MADQWQTSRFTMGPSAGKKPSSKERPTTAGPSTKPIKISRPKTLPVYDRQVRRQVLQVPTPQVVKPLPSPDVPDPVTLVSPFTALRDPYGGYPSEKPRPLFRKRVTLDPDSLGLPHDYLTGRRSKSKTLFKKLKLRKFLDWICMS